MLKVHNDKKVYVPKVQNQKKNLSETHMRTSWKECWRWSNKDETFIHYFANLFTCMF